MHPCPVNPWTNERVPSFDVICLGFLCPSFSFPLYLLLRMVSYCWWNLRSNSDLWRNQFRDYLKEVGEERDRVEASDVSFGVFYFSSWSLMGISGKSILFYNLVFLLPDADRCFAIVRNSILCISSCLFLDPSAQSISDTFFLLPFQDNSQILASLIISAILEFLLHNIEPQNSWM